jgi:hypothetical protein
MEHKDIAAKVIDMVKNNEKDKIMPFIKDQFDDEKELFMALIGVQIQMKEIGGGWPPVGNQITTLDEIKVYTDLATKFALEKDKLTAGKLYHNFSSFCTPNMDDGVDENYAIPAYEAAVKDLEIREELGHKGQML